MRVAVVHDWLNQKVGGAEFVLFEIMKQYPEADLFALTYNRKTFRPYLGMREVRTSFLQHMPRFLKRRPQYLLPLVRRAVASFDFAGYDLVISNSTAWSKNVRVPEGVKHLSYCHSPARMIWDSWPGYLDTKGIKHSWLGSLKRFFITKMTSRLRLWDYYATSNIDLIVGNSRYIARRIKKFYGVEAPVLYPPVDAPARDHLPSEEPYYLVLSVLSRYKNIDLAVIAFKSSGKNLVIAGDGPDQERLVALAEGAENIVFEGRVNDQRRDELMAGAEAFIFPSIEDFGITPVEAMSFGTPVIALKGGGLMETVQEGVSGIIFDRPTMSELKAAVLRAENTSWQQKAVQQVAEKFTKEEFAKNLSDYVAKVMG
jgi:glycosyltransferase involved in cell wall biosynthesis